MDFWETVVVMARRWYVALPAFVLALGAAAGVYSSVHKLYTSTSVLVMTQSPTGAMQPADPSKPRDLANPLLSFDSALSLSAAIIIQALNTPEVATELGIVQGGDTWFQVTNGSTNPELLITGPFVFIQGNSGTAGGAQDIVAKVADRARVELINRQRELKAPSSTYISAIEVVPPTTPVAKGGSRIRAAAAAGMLGLLATLTITFGFERYQRARRRRHRDPIGRRNTQARQPIGGS